jgi:hypothetical protein
VARAQKMGRPFKLTDHQKREAIKRRNQGETLADIARSYNVFKLMPPAMADGSWTETVLHSFGDTGCDDGSQPLAGVIFDKSGALYGTTVAGGSLGCDVNVGTVNELEFARPLRARRLG